MSGRKRVYVDEAEWQRLQRQAASLAQVRQDVPRLIEEVRNQTQNDIERSMNQFEQRHAEVERTLDALSEETKRVEAETSQRINQAARKARQEVDRATRTLRAENRAQLTEEAQTRRAEIAEERRIREVTMGRLTSRVEEIENDKARAAELAAQWLTDSWTMTEAIGKLPHERYAPDELEHLRAKLFQAKNNESLGLGAENLSAVQGYYLDLSNLRNRVERDDLAYRGLRADVERTLATLQALIGQNSQLSLAEGIDPADGAELSVDYWSRGALDRLQAEIRLRLAEVRDDADPVQIERLEQLRDRSAPHYEQQIQAVVAQAGTALYASQLRANFADLILEVLEEQHFYTHSDSTYEGEDPRNGFYARAQHGDGSQVVIQVEPIAADRPECDVQILNYDQGQESAETRSARSESIQRNLSANGLAVVGVQEEVGDPDPALQDIEAIRRGRSPVQTHQQLRGPG